MLTRKTNEKGDGGRLQASHFPECAYAHAIEGVREQYLILEVPSGIHVHIVARGAAGVNGRIAVMLQDSYMLRTPGHNIEDHRN
jgi:calcineurin-like phosphoesterase family protein